jgi:hypothetical protein
MAIKFVIHLLGMEYYWIHSHAFIVGLKESSLFIFPEVILTLKLNKTNWRMQHKIKLYNSLIIMLIKLASYFVMMSQFDK